MIPQIDRMRADEMLAIVRTLDDVLNNTSLILLFEVGDKRLLFPGDAQIENWSYALFRRPNREDPRAARRRRLLQGRPPRQPQRDAEDAVERIRHRASETSPDRLITFVSTLSSKHGSKSPRHRGAAPTTCRRARAQ